MRIARGIAVITLSISMTFLLVGQNFRAQETTTTPADTPHPAAPAVPPPTIADIERWVAELGHPQFSVREQATQSLGKAGTPAIKPLQDATRDKQLEVSIRAVRALRLIFESATDDAFDQAETALEQIRDSRNLARRAELALTMRTEDRQRRAIARIEQLGGEIRMTNAASSRTVNNVIVVDDDQNSIEQLLLGEDWTGGDAGLKYVKRVSRVGNIYITPGSKITSEAIVSLKAELPGTEVQLRGSAMLGVSCDTFDARLRVNRVQAGSGAEAAGLQANDLIVKFEGNEIHDFQVIIETTRNRKVGDKLTVEIERDGAMMTKVITLGKWTIKDLASSNPNSTPIPLPQRRPVPPAPRQREP